jgi:hypothetical protein
MNPMTRQWVFLEYNTGYGRWFPHAATMHAWAQDQIRVYRPTDNPTTLITMPDKQYWPAMSPSDYPYIATATVPESWVPNQNINTALNEEEIDVYDRMLVDPPPELTPLVTLNSMPLTTLAGLLLSMGPPQQQGPPPLVLSVIENTAPEPQYRTEWALETLLRSLAPPPPTQPQTTQSPTPQLSQSLPPHVAAIMIQHAETTGATCPITMEPLTAKNATVTACGHIFDRDALARWTGTCPECRCAL